MELLHVKAFIEKYNRIVNNPDVAQEDKLFMDIWKTHFTIALINDLGKPIAENIGNLMTSICCYDSEEV